MRRASVRFLERSAYTSRCVVGLRCLVVDLVSQPKKSLVLPGSLRFVELALGIGALGHRRTKRFELQLDVALSQHGVAARTVHRHVTQAAIAAQQVAASLLRLLLRLLLLRFGLSVARRRCLPLLLRHSAKRVDGGAQRGEPAVHFVRIRGGQIVHTMLSAACESARMATAHLCVHGPDDA